MDIGRSLHSYIHTSVLLVERKPGLNHEDTKARSEDKSAQSGQGQLNTRLAVPSCLRVFVVAFFSVDEREFVRFQQCLGVLLPGVQPFRRLARRSGELGDAVELRYRGLPARGGLRAGQFDRDGPAERVEVDARAAVDDEVDRVALLDRNAVYVRVGLPLVDDVARELALALGDDAAADAVALIGVVIELAGDGDGAVAGRGPAADDRDAVS